MASEKAAKILRVRSDFSEEQIQAMPDREAWDWIYRHLRSADDLRPDQICFSGFSLSVRAELEAQARELLHLEVKSSVTKGLRYLCTGPEAGPAKVAKAKEQGATILSVEQFQTFCETGEIPA